MTSLALRVLLCLGIWTAATSALTFTNSFAGWTVNMTYTLKWDSSKSDPDYFDLVLARPHGVESTGVEIDSTWPIDWAMNVATQIPSNGDHFYKFTLPPDCQLGFYYLAMQADKHIPVTSTFFIAPVIGSSEATTTEIPSSTAPVQGTMTISSFIPVTATQSVIGTSDGQLVTFKPSDVFSSAVVYTTIVVTTGGGKGTPPGRVHLIVGVSLGALFLITMPIIVWLILRYRRRPLQLSSSDSISDKRPPPSDAENLPNSSTLDLLSAETASPTSVSNNLPTSITGTRQVWVIVDGEKRQMTIPRYPPRSMSPADNQDPFADPVVPARRQSLPRIVIPQSVAQPNSSAPSSSTTAIDTLLSRENTTTSRTNPSLMYSQHEPNAEAQANEISDTARLREKVSRPRQRPAQEARLLSPEEVAARIFVPGRAVDMGPLGRDRIGDMDENGLLPPDYSQATQPLTPPQRPPQAGPAAH